MISAECWDWDKKVIMRGNSGCKSDNSFADGNSVPERTLFLTAHKASNARLRITRWTKHKEVDDWQEQYAFLLHGDRSRRFLRSSSPSLSPAGTWALTQPITLPICYLTAITSRTVTGKDGEHCFRENVIFPTWLNTDVWLLMQHRYPEIQNLSSSEGRTGNSVFVCISCIMIIL